MLAGGAWGCTHKKQKSRSTLRENHVDAGENTTSCTSSGAQEHKSQRLFIKPTQGPSRGRVTVPCFSNPIKQDWIKLHPRKKSHVLPTSIRSTMYSTTRLSRVISRCTRCHMRNVRTIVTERSARTCRPFPRGVATRRSNRLDVCRWNSTIPQNTAGIHCGRTHTCGELRASDVGKNAVLCGWVERVRDFGDDLAFVVLRDGTGTVQLTVRGSDSPLRSLPQESVVLVKGDVTLRPPDMVNSAMPTGAIEVVVEDCTVLNVAQDVPFTVSSTDTDDNLANETVRQTFRYIDLRRRQLQRVRAAVPQILSQWKTVGPICFNP